MKILVVENDQATAKVLQFLFSSYSYAVDLAEDGDVGLQMANAFPYDLILLDAILPKLDGISLCQSLRNKGFQGPIMLLTGQIDSQQKVVALNTGADDYVVKPFDREELLARVQALLRRGSLTRHPTLTWGGLSIDPTSRRVTYGNHLLSVTPKEYGILELFLRTPQKILSSRAILDHVWTSLESPGEEAVRVHIKDLRQKFTAIGAPKDFIKTKYRVGYQLNPLYSNLLAAQVEQQVMTPEIIELATVNEELRLALENLQVAEEELQQENEELKSMQRFLELERQRYQDLFEFAPNAYLVTDINGVIQEANRAAYTLFHIDFPHLIGKPLIYFIAESDRREFHLRLIHRNFSQNLEVTIKTRPGDSLPTLISMTSIKNGQGEIVGLCWLLHDIHLYNRSDVF